MKIKTKIMCFAAAAILAAASIMPVGVFAETDIADADVRDRITAQRIWEENMQCGKEAAENAWAAGVQNENSTAEAASGYSDVYTVEINADKAETVQGRSVTFSGNEFEYDYSHMFNTLSGTLVFKNGDYVRTVNYSRINFDLLYKDYGDPEFNLLIPREIPVGEYDVSVDLSDVSSGRICGDFKLVISENPDPPAELRNVYGEDNVEVGYNEYLPIIANSGDIYYIVMTMDDEIYISGRGSIDYGCGILPGSGSISGLMYLHNDNQSFYESTTSLPLTLNAPKQESVSHNGAVELPNAYNNKIDFKTPLPQGSLRDTIIKFVSKTTGKAADFDGLFYYDLMYNENGNITGLEINTYFISPYKSDEYEIYILDRDSMTEYGPVDVNFLDYRLGSSVYSTKSDKLSIYYQFAYDSYDFEGVEYADVMLTDDSGKVYLDQLLVPQYYYSGELCVEPMLPDVFKGGDYIISLELHYSDGTFEKLPGIHIIIDECSVVSYMECDHEYLTPSTTNMSVLVEFDEYIGKPEDYAVVLKDRHGDELGRSEKCYFMRSEPSEIIYDLSVKNDFGDYVLGDYYKLELISTSGVPVGGHKTTRLALEDVPVVIGSKAVDEFNINVMTENTAEGEYDVYANRNSNKRVGILRANGSGSAVLTFEQSINRLYELYILFNGDYIPICNIYKLNRTSTVRTRQFMLCGNAALLNNISVEIIDTKPYNPDNIISVQLCSGGEVLAEGFNIRVNEQLSTGGGVSMDVYPIGAKYIRRDALFYTTVLADFKEFDQKLLKDGSAYIKLETNSGEFVTNSFEYIEENEFCSGAYARIDCNNLYYDIEGDYVASDSIDFTISGTNYTEGEAALCEYNTETDELSEPLASIQLSDLEKVVNNGLYDYRGSFKNIAQPGKTYKICYRNQKEEEAGVAPSDIISSSYVLHATDRPCVYFDQYNYNMSSSVLELYNASFNLDSGRDKFTAKFQNGSMTADIPVEIKPYEYYNTYTGLTETDTRFRFDFSKIAKSQGSGVVSVYLNGENIGCFGVYDMRDKTYTEYTMVTAVDGREVIYISGGNLDKGNFEIKVWDLSEYNMKEVRGEYLLRDVMINPSGDESDYCLMPLDFPGLPEGRYMLELYLDGEPVTLEDNLVYIRSYDGDPDTPVAVAKSLLNGENMIVDLVNTSNEELNVGVIVGAYDRNGALVDMSEVTPVTISANGELKDTAVSISPDAARYKVFVWDDLVNMKPYAK